MATSRCLQFGYFGFTKKPPWLSTHTAIYRFVKNKLIRQIAAPEGGSDERARWNRICTEATPTGSRNAVTNQTNQQTSQMTQTARSDLLIVVNSSGPLLHSLNRHVVKQR